MKKIFCMGLIGTIVLISISHQAVARGINDDCANWGKSRVLNNHAFIPLNLVDWAFATTHVGSSLGGGLFKMTVPGVDENGNAVAAQTISLAALQQEVRTALSITDWVALRANFAGTMYAGTSLQDLLGDVGVVFEYNLNGGAAFRVFATDTMRFAVGLNAGLNKGKQISPGNAIRKAVDSGDFRQAISGLLIDRSRWNVSPVAMFAFAPIHFIGLQTSVTVDVGTEEVGSNSATSTTLRWGTGVTLEGNAWHIPLAIPVAYQLVNTFGDFGRTDHQVEAGLFYSGRSDLDLGIAAATMIGAKDTQLYTGQVRLVYIW